MDIGKFTEDLVRLLKEKTGTDVCIRSNDVVKLNDTKLHAVAVCPLGEHICRNFYAEAYYEDYQNGTSLETIAERILTYAEDEKLCGMKRLDWLPHIFEFEKVADKITAKLISKELNTEYLKDKCWMEYLDLAVCFQIEVGSDDRGIMTVALDKSVFEAWGIPMERLFSIAMDNLKALHSWKAIGMSELLVKLALENSGEDDFARYMNPPEYQEGLFVATNETKTNGATCMLDKGVVKSLAEKENVKKVAVIPSSIHEIILMPLRSEDDMAEVESLNRMIAEVNETQVRPDEVLGNHVYIYNVVDNEYHY